jgi:hypothetical protein
MRPGGDDDRVRALEGLESVLGDEADAAHGLEPAGLRRADHELVPVLDVELGAAQAEDLDHDAELERCEAVEDESGDAMIHGAQCPSRGRAGLRPWPKVRGSCRIRHWRGWV